MVELQQADTSKVVIWMMRELSAFTQEWVIRASNTSISRRAVLMTWEDPSP